MMISMGYHPTSSSQQMNKTVVLVSVFPWYDSEILVMPYNISLFPLGSPTALFLRGLRRAFAISRDRICGLGLGHTSIVACQWSPL